MHPQQIIELLDMSYEPSERTRQRLLAEASLSDLLVALDASPSDIVREHLCIVLQALPKDELLKAWQTGLSPLVKSWLCSVLRDQPDEQTMQILIAALNDEDSMLQSWAIEALGEIDSPLVGPALRARFLVQTDDTLRGWLAYALGQVGYRPASAALFSALEEKGEEKSNLRRYAADALQRLQAPGAGEAIQQALAQATEPDEIAELYLSLELAAGKLTREDLTGQRILQLLAEPPENQISLLSHIERTAAIEELVSALQRATTPEMRAILCYRIARRGETFAVPILLEVLQDSDSGVRCEAANALAHIGLVSSGEAIQQAFEREHDDRVRDPLIDALGSTKRIEAIPQIIQALASPNSFVRAGSARALGKMNAQEAKEALRLAFARETDSHASRRMHNALKALELF